ncbi:MAG: CdaR family protein [Defluviitaleaceae bacterium]|nr:CdaR family protein [Defluviitaleaceae bacterium]MCL2263040.1 CdaR family protein [Defluviitaleaceae bacterium]
MFKKLTKAVFDDLQWMLLALAAATVIWFIGMNMSDPYQNQTVPSQRLRLDNLGIMAREGIVVLNYDALREMDVAVTVRARRSDMDGLRTAMTDAGIIGISVDFRAVDSDAVLRGYGISAQRLRISPNLPAGFEHLSITPPYVDVYLDNFTQQTHSVQVIQEGEVFPGFELQHIRLGNERVTISGPHTYVGMVGKVQASVDITGIHDDAELPVQIAVLDVFGYEMTERVNLSVTETTAAVRVWQARPVDIIVRGVGTLASGFAPAGYDSDGISVEIVGAAETLDAISQIYVEIDLTGERENTTRTIFPADWLPEGVSLRQGEITEFEVTAIIEPIDIRTFTVPHGNIRSRGVVGLYQLVDTNAAIRVTVSGPRSMIAALDATQIEPEFDLRGRAIGVHNVPLVIGLPDGLSVVGHPPSLLVQIHEPAIAANGEDEEEEYTPAEMEESEQPEEPQAFEVPQDLDIIDILPEYHAPYTPAPDDYIEEDQDLGALPQTP